jgi:DNA-binding transcriptional ArsR family regulator
MEQSPPIVAELTLREIAAIKVYAHTRRMRIFALLQRPATVKEIGAALGVAPSKLYYHINLLLNHGLIQVVGQSTESGIVEKIYQAAARRVNLVNPLLLGDALPADATAAILDTLVEEAQQELRQALAQRDPTEPTPPRHPFVSKRTFRLNEDQLTALHAHLVALIQDVTALGQENAELNGPDYGLTVLFYRKELP